MKEADTMAKEAPKDDGFWKAYLAKHRFPERGHVMVVPVRPGMCYLMHGETMRRLVVETGPEHTADDVAKLFQRLLPGAQVAAPMF
jgi:hypothetical protein